MNTEVMIDIETLDTAHTAIVFQMGIIIFNSETGEAIEEHLLNLDADYQLMQGRTVSISTLQFWTNPAHSNVAHQALNTSTEKQASAKHSAYFKNLLINQRLFGQKAVLISIY